MTQGADDVLTVLVLASGAGSVSLAKVTCRWTSHHSFETVTDLAAARCHA